MDKRIIPIRVTGERLEALHSLCVSMKEDFKPENEHGRLLKEYMLELEHRLQQMVDRRQERYTLNLTGTEAMAFYQLWNMLDIRHDRYAKVIVGGLLQKMSALAS
ncbi:MAG: hypothetical protein P4L41_15140 [Flavipsychrobacter sp.]|jgi:hypothetical protein|nr:hypothetical protein [Flavipsychrobacter sp.]